MEITRPALPEDVTIILWCITFGVIIFLLFGSFIFIIGKRKKWWSLKSEAKPSCPICRIASNEMLPMPRLAKRPKEWTLPWFKLLWHWEIKGSDVLACPVCVEKAWAEARVKLEEMYVADARDKERKMRDLYEFQINLLTPLKDRNGNKQAGK